MEALLEKQNLRFLEASSTPVPDRLVERWPQANFNGYAPNDLTPEYTARASGMRLHDTPADGGCLLRTLSDADRKRVAAVTVKKRK